MVALKQFIVKGIAALSLICVATIAEAIPVNVINGGDLIPPTRGSLRAAVNGVNAPLSLVDEIRFNAGFQINLRSTLPTFTRQTAEIVSRAGLKIHQNNDITQTIFDVAAGSELHLVENTLGGNSSWYGGMSGPAGAVIRLEEQQSLTYPGGFSGAATVICQGAGQTTLSGQSTGNLQLADAGGGVKIPTGGSWDGPVTIGATTLEMNGGAVTQAINGLANSALNVTGAFTPTAAITNVGSINVAAGQTLTVNTPITGYTGLTVADTGSVVLNNGGNLSNGITLGNSTFTFNGGTYSGDVVGVAGSEMNVNSTLTAPAAITADTLNINPGGVFTPSANVTTNVGLNVFQGGTLLLTNNLGGIGATVDNAGTVTHNTNAIRTIAGNFTQEANGTINIGITNAGAGQYSQLQVNGNTVLNGGVMNVQLLSGAQITNGAVFDIITSTGGIAAGPILPTVPKASLFFGFRPVVTGNRLQLIATRSGCMCINTVPSLNGIAKKMDDLSGNNKFQPVLDILTQQTSQKAFENKLEELAPTGLNGMHIVMAQESNGAEQVLLRLDTLRAMGTGGALARTGYIRTGYAAGDVMEDRASFSPVIFGNSTKQSSIQGLSGYDATTAGFGFLGDAPILEHFRVGLGVSYANSVVRQFNNTGSHTTIGSTQGMAYGSTTYGRLFLDAVLSAGINNYKGKRNVTFIGPTATSRYNGFQYGAKVKTGFAIPCDRINISPIAAAQYMHLNVGQYTEQGAGTLLNQHISSMQANTVRVSLGGRIAESSQEGTFFPEFHAFYINDVKNPQMIITSQFVEGGASFDSKSVVPPREGINAGASITAMVSDDFTLSGGYDLEAKRSFKSHSASLKFKFLF